MKKIPPLENEVLLMATGLLDKHGKKIQNPDLNQMNSLSKTSKTNSAAIEARAHLKRKKQELINSIIETMDNATYKQTQTL